MDSTDLRSDFNNRRERLKMARIINPSNSSGYQHNSSPQDLSVSSWENPLVVHHFNPNFGNPDAVLDYPHYSENSMSMNHIGEFYLNNGSGNYIQPQEDVYDQNSQMNLVTVASSGTGNVNSPGEPDDSSSWMNRPVGMNVNRWNENWSCNVTSKCDQEPRMFLPGSGRQALSLSLSSDPISGKSSGKPLHEVMVHGSSSNNPRHIAPLGPFTGYATILKSSRFLKPAQEMLDEVCSICVGSKFKDQGATEAYGDEATVKDNGAMGRDDTGDLFSTRRGCNEIGKSSSSKCFMLENHEINAKLMRLLDEVCRRYRLHNEQIQMVVSSFESVAGLNTATPFISVALKRIAKSFQRLKTTISNHLKLISNSFKDKNTNNNNTNNNSSSFQNQKNPFGGHVESQHHIWRPQRGLPERSVAILRAWLFDHFLHPYPTDTDKQMLANQTGLSRNQVSNWFINARVRVWKPMVEEIHTLETKGLTTTTSTPSRNRRSIENKGPNNGEIFNQEKRSRADYPRNSSLLDDAATSSSSSMMGLGLNQRNGFEIGVGNVSLTLGLRYGVEGIQQPQQQEERLGMIDQDRFGSSHMLHDLLG